MNAKPTPGPWYQHGATRLVWTQPLVDGDGYRIDQSLTANARLIAAAPDLLEACEAIANSNGYGADVPDDYDDEHGWLVSAGSIRRVAAAISKARGE